MAETIPSPTPDPVKTEPVITTRTITENGHTYLLTLKDGVEVAREARTSPPPRMDPVFDAAAFTAATGAPTQTEVGLAVRWLVKQELLRTPIR